MIPYFDHTTTTWARTGVFLAFVWAGWVVLTYAGWWDLRQRRVPNAVWGWTWWLIPGAMMTRDPWYIILGLVMIVPFVILMRYHRVWGSGDSKAVLWAFLVGGGFVSILALVPAAYWAKRHGFIGVPFVHGYARCYGIMAGIVTIILIIIKVL